MSSHKYLKYKTKYALLKRQMGGQSTPALALADDIYFWSRQMMEHAVLFYLGLTNDQLKAEAHDIQTAWQTFREGAYADIQSKPDLVFLSDAELATIGNVDTSKVLELINRTLTYNEKVVSILDTNTFQGSIYLALAKHILEETEYFQKKVKGDTLSAKEEIAFINKHNGEETAVTAQLIDPNPDNWELINKIRSLSEKSKIDPELASYLDLSTKYAVELAAFAADSGTKIDNHELSSIISPMLAHHVHREYVRFAETLKALQGRNNNTTH